MDAAKKRRHLPADSFPGRYLETRPWAEEMYERARKRYVPKAARYEEFERATLAPQAEFERKAFGSAVRRVGRDFIQHVDLLNRMNEETLAHTFYAWVMEGRHMFVLDAALTRLLAQTSIEDVPLSSIHTPYAEFYLSLDGADVSILGSKLIGAFIDRRQRFLDVMLIVERSAQGMSTDLDEALYRIERHLGVDVVMRVPDGEPDVVSIEHLAGEWIDCRIPGLVIEQALFIQEQRSTLGLPLDSESAVNQPRFKALLHDRSACMAALRLVVNALFYITAYREKCKPTWPDAPPAWVTPLSNPKLSEKSRYRARAKLLQEGYSEVWICGADEIAHSEVDPAAPGGATVASHWRRGHWRQQAIGVGRADRRLTWIRPVLVNPGHTEPRARLYHVSPQ